MKKKPIYIFNGGTEIHPMRGSKCTLGWCFDTSPSHYMVYFLEPISDAYNYEICHIDNLEPTDEYLEATW